MSIARSRKQAIERTSGVFSGKAEASEGAREGEIDQLSPKIGWLKIIEKPHSLGYGYIV